MPFQSNQIHSITFFRCRPVVNSGPFHSPRTSFIPNCWKKSTIHCLWLFFSKLWVIFVTVEQRITVKMWHIKFFFLLNHRGTQTLWLFTYPSFLKCLTMLILYMWSTSAIILISILIWSSMIARKFLAFKIRISTSESSEPLMNNTLSYGTISINGKSFLLLDSIFPFQK